MELSEAIQLINGADLDAGRPVTWADLGCGKGIFTRALAVLLPEGSTLYAVDKIAQQAILNPDLKTDIIALQADFVNEFLPLPPLDGVLMANSLHYVADKHSLLKKLKHHFLREEKYIIVEYDTMNSNPWIPYPVDFDHLKDLFYEAGLKQITRVGEKRSIYRRENLYTCFIRNIPPDHP
ncbi:MAG: class I SAM-dependent methyltransferase [Cyclobacteriaceae bacterium]|nr:class I SAM-dependent methyltransferase [Cyclobacteriaceae bacterium]